MTDGYTRRPFLLRGALVEFSERFLGPVPNVILFQYNPESMTRRLEAYTPPAFEEQRSPEEAPTAQPYHPPETFSLNLLLDASDALEEPDSHPVAVATGIADRLAALEILMYPQESETLLGSVANTLLGTSSDVSAARRNEVPIVLFVWGPGRIVPVRLTEFSVDEQYFSPLLYPIQAKVTIGLRVLTDGDIDSYDGASALVKEIAKGAYKLSRFQKKALAAANLANSVESILGLLPF
jgi:hypothetical protein